MMEGNMEDIDYNGNSGVLLGPDAQADWVKRHDEHDKRMTTTAHEATESYDPSGRFVARSAVRDNPQA